MAHGKQGTSLDELDKPYEPNVIGVKGIAYFTIGLFLLIVVTFGLMWVLWDVLERDAVATKSSNNPLMMSDAERLPPEPRLQGAPGFEVRGPDGRINLELREPQAEWRELKKIWEKQLAEGQKHPETGVVIALPIEAAIDKFLSQQVKAKTGEDAARAAEESRMYYTDASSGRLKAEKRR